MKVNIEGSIFVESDGVQFVLKEYTGKYDEDGKERFKTLGFYGNINHVIKSLLQMKIMQSTAKDLKELLKEVEKIKQDINEKITV